ncbi:MAG: HEAT repeat domain-containing protein [Desulfobacterales bacterium]|nr:HEAT repeat domain-containing protein [Desulfobacterales bacterium]
MANEYSKNKSFKGGVAKVINAGGKATVVAYDATVYALNKIYESIKMTPDLAKKSSSIVTSGFGFIKPDAIKQVEKKIKGYEEQIKNLYFELGKEGAQSYDEKHPLESEVIKKLIADIREHEKEIDRLKNRVTEIKEEEKAEKLKAKTTPKLAEIKKQQEEKIDHDNITKSLEDVIKKALKTSSFDTRSEEEIFKKVANDLLDKEMEIKCLAAAELGKIGSTAGVPILLEAAKFKNPELISEIINSLINIGDKRAVSLFNEEIKSPKYRVRIGCLRGLYKIAGAEEAMPIITEALRDEHPEVKRTALTFIGWKDYEGAIPSIIQCLRDDDVRVKKAAVSALANIKDEVSVLPLINMLWDKDLEVREKTIDAIKVITGENIIFDAYASGEALKQSIENLKSWWEKERINVKKVEEPLFQDIQPTPEVETETEAAAETKDEELSEKIETETETETDAETKDEELSEKIETETETETDEETKDEEHSEKIETETEADTETKDEELSEKVETETEAVAETKDEELSEKVETETEAVAETKDEELSEKVETEADAETKDEELSEKVETETVDEAKDKNTDEDIETDEKSKRKNGLLHPYSFKSY